MATAEAVIVGVSATLLIPTYFCVEYVVILCAISLGTRGALGRLGLGGPVLGIVVAYAANSIVALVSLLTVPLSGRIAGPEVGSVVALPMGLENLTSNTPDLFGVGWIPAVAILALIGVVAAICSVERHTCLA